MSYVFAIKILLSFVSVFTSLIVDYNNKKNILIFTSLGQGIVLCLLLSMYLTNNISTPILIIFVTIQTIFSTFSTPAQNAILPLLISDNDTIIARSATCMFQQFIQIFSYISSGTLISIIGIKGAIVIDIITFFIASVLIFFVEYKETFENIKEYGNFINVSKDGFKFIFSSKIIIVILLVTFLGNLFASPIDSLSIAYFGDFFIDTTVYPVFMSSVAIGGVLGTFFLTKIKNKFCMNQLLALGFVFGGVGAMLLIYKNIFIVILAGFLYGLSNGFVSIMNGVLLQVNTPKEMMGRVFSAFRCISFSSGPIGIMCVGYIGEYFELNKIFFSLGLMLIITAIVSLIYTKNSANF
jgi:MFS transporter